MTRGSLSWMPTEVVCLRLEVSSDIYYIPTFACFLYAEALSPLCVQKKRKNHVT